jgi:Spy/CpxP family protein refolding chaperone
MDNAVKVKWLMGFIVVLILINIATVTAVWMHPGRPDGPGGPGAPRRDMLRQELNLSSEQEKQFGKLKSEHHDAVDPIRANDRKLHDAFFDLLKGGDEHKAEVDSILTLMAAGRKTEDSLVFAHLTKVRKICTPEQQQKFDEVIAEAMRANAPRQGGPPPPRP